MIIRKIMILSLVLLLLSCNSGFGLGETDVTIENLKRDISRPEQLAVWMRDNLMYRKFANDGDQGKLKCLRTRVADCDDYAEVAYEWLRASSYYNPILVSIGTGSGGHVIVMFWESGWKFFSNDKIITVRNGTHYQDIANAVSRDWHSINIFEYGKLRKSIKNGDPLVKAGA